MSWEVLKIHKRNGKLFANIWNNNPEKDSDGCVTLSDYVPIEELINYGIIIKYEEK